MADKSYAHSLVKEGTPKLYFQHYTNIWSLALRGPGHQNSLIDRQPYRLYDS